MTSELQSSLRTHATREFFKSIVVKSVLFLITVAAIALLIFLDVLKKHGQDGKDKPITQKRLADHLKAFNQAELVEASAAIPGDARFASTDEAFSSIYAESKTEKSLLATERAVRDSYDRQVSEADKRIGKLFQASPRDQEFDEALARQLERRTALMTARQAEIGERPTEKNAIRARYEPAFQRVDAAIATLLAQDPSPSKFDELLARYLAVRTALTTARSNELQELAQQRTTKRDELKRTFDKTQPGKTAKSFSYFGANDGLNNFVANVVDSKHPLNILYEMLWYASVILAVVCFAALLLSPLFRAVPVQGAQEPLADRLKQLFSTGSRVAARNVATLGAVAVGTMAVVGASSALPSSPHYTPPPKPARVVVKAPAPVLPPSTTSGEDIVEPPELPEDPKEAIKALVTQVQGLQALANEIKLTVDTHEERLKKQYEELKTRALAGHTHPEPDTTAINNRLTELTTKLGQAAGTIDQLSGRIGTTETNVGSLARSTTDAFAFTRESITGLSQRADATDKLVAAAAKAASDRADKVEEVVVLPQHVGDRAPMLSSVLGFDRYRNTEHSQLLLTKMNAPPNVRNAAEELSDGLHTNDDVRRKLLETLCGSNKPCDLYKEWLPKVLRVTRAN